MQNGGEFRFSLFDWEHDSGMFGERQVQVFMYRICFFLSFSEHGIVIFLKVHWLNELGGEGRVGA